MASLSVQVRQPLIGIPCFAQEYQPAAVPGILQDELEAIDAIFGDGTTELVHAYNGKILVRMKLPDVDLPILELAFPVSYPEHPPEVDCNTIGRERSYRIRSARLIVLSVLQIRFVKGLECIFDLLDTCLSMLSLLRGDGLNMEAAVTLVPGFVADQWLWVKSGNVNNKNVYAIETCAICFDDQYAFKMVKLQSCQHYFCIECFQTGWRISSKSAQPYTCCQKRIALDIIETFNSFQTAEIRRYLRMLQERDITHPFYCGFASCSSLIGSTKDCRTLSKDVIMNGVKCPKCSGHTCVKCNMPWHFGKCNEDNDLNLLMDEDVFRRCPGCGQGVQKNGGCQQMKCTSCEIYFRWEENGAVTLYRS